jgi:hypothetical protein
MPPTSDSPNASAANLPAFSISPSPAAADAGACGARKFAKAAVPHHLVVIADLSRTLREEELQAGSESSRVLGHELNNSLAPIKSIAASLARSCAVPRRAADWEDDLRSGLEIIGTRADSLARFMQAYARSRAAAADARTREFARWCSGRRARNPTAVVG